MLSFMEEGADKVDDFDSVIVDDFTGKISEKFTGERVMEESVCIIMGEWTCCENGVWKFVLTQGVMARCVSIGRETTFAAVKSEIGKVFCVDTKRMSIGISFWFEGESTVFTQTKMPPVVINSEAEFALFKRKGAQSDGGLNLYITLSKLVEEEHQEPQSHDDIIRLEDEECDLDSLDDDLVASLENIESVHARKKAKTMDKRFGNVYEDDRMDNVVGSVDENLMISMDENKYRDVDKDYGMDNNAVNTMDETLAQSVVDNNACAGYSMDNNAVGTAEQHRYASVDNDDAADVDMRANSDDSFEDTPDYDFDEWTEKINNDYPLNWDPYKVSVPTSNMQLLNSLVLGNRVMALGDTSGTSNTELEDVRRLDTSWIGDDDFMSDGGPGPVIDENDPLLLNDAAPFLDNFGDEPTHQMNRDGLRGRDDIYVGRIFANKADLHNALSINAMKTISTFRIEKSDNKRVIAICVDKKCGWRVYATIHQNSANVEIKTLTLKHTCDVSARSKYGEKATAKVLAGLLQSKYANGKKGPRACELPEMVLSELNVPISYMKAWNAKELAMKSSRGSEEQSYTFLAKYLHLVTSTNPGTITDMHTTFNEKGKTLFKYLFFAFGPCIDGYKYLRKVIVIDGTSLKGKYNGCLVAASGQDGNMQIFPLAFGVVDCENDAGWVWFFKNLSKFVPDEEGLVFVSDRHQSIYSGLRKVYPLAYHGACTVHLFRNVKHRYKCEGLANIVSKAARAFTLGDFRYHWAEIEKRNKDCAEYLLNIGLPHWTLSHFPGKRYNLMSSNISESLNAALQKAVDFPIVSMVEFIRTMLMRWFWYRRTYANKIRTRCTPEIEKLLIEQHTKSTACRVLGASDWIYQVNDATGYVFTVDLERKTCTCRLFDVLQIPCSHALAARLVRNVDQYTLVGADYFVGPWRELYKGIIMPVPNERDSHIPHVVEEVSLNPPKTKRGGGRPRKVRIPSQGEIHHGKKRKP